jgi:hypothetical protein
VRSLRLGRAWFCFRIGGGYRAYYDYVAGRSREERGIVLFLNSLRHRAFTLPIFLLVFAAAFFRLPYYFPVSSSLSASYVFQYNNRVAVLVFLAGAAAFAILFRGLSLQPATRDSRVSRVSALFAAVFCVGLGLLYWWISSPEGIHGDVPYFYSRLCELAAGKTIYRDFEFVYGPLLLYLPLWTGRLFHLSLIHGYVLFWLVDWAVGIWILYGLVNAIEIPSPYRTAVFFLLVADFIPALWLEGLNYAPVRGLLTAGLAMLVYAAHKRQYPPPAVAGVAILSAAIAACVSPEYGIAFMLGTGLFLVACVRRRAPGYWPSVAATGFAFLAINGISARMGVYTTLRSFSTGGLNYPILPYPGVLFVMGIFLIAACVAYLAFQRGQTDSLTVYLLCICLFSLPSGFGRADSSHMQLGAFSAVIVAALALGRYPRVFLLGGLAFLYWAALPPIRSDFPAIREHAERRLFDPARRAEPLYRTTVLIFHMLHRDAHRTSIEAKVALYYSEQVADPVLPDGAIVSAPLGFTVRGFTDDSGRVDYGYFLGAGNTIVPSQVDSIIRWLEAHPERKLILPRDWESLCYAFREGDDPSFRTWYGIHWASPKRQMRVYFPLGDFIRMNYAPDEVPLSEWAGLWHPKGASEPAAPPVASAAHARR